MLAQNFKSAADLGITEAQKNALMKTLVLFETGKIKHAHPDDVKFEVNNDWPVEPSFGGYFNLATWGDVAPCGTIACIGGTAEAVSGVSFDGWMNRPGSRLHDLFAPHDLHDDSWRLITPEQAAVALRSYLTTGNANWTLAVSSKER